MIGDLSGFINSKPTGWQDFETEFLLSVHGKVPFARVVERLKRSQDMARRAVTASEMETTTGIARNNGLRRRRG